MNNKLKATAMETAYNLIIQKITSEHLKPGSPLREEHLAKEFNLSATPVREAFRHLEHEGWVRSIPYRGTFLRTYTPDEIEDLYLLREAIEGMAIREAAKRGDNEDLKRVQIALEAEKRHIDGMRNTSNKTKSSYIPDLDFHCAIVAASHSKLLLERNMTLRLQLNTINLGSLLPRTELETFEVYEEHQMIFRALERRWGDAAEDLLRRHISNARDKHLKLLTSCPTDQNL